MLFRSGVQAFSAYAGDSFGPADHTNLTTNSTLDLDATVQTLRFGGATGLAIGDGVTLGLSLGGLLIPATVTDSLELSGGALTSTWAAGDNDLMIYNFGQGLATISSVIEDDGLNPVNLVLAGNGVTRLSGLNTVGIEDHQRLSRSIPILLRCHGQA